jgi:hypothetical protein
MVFCDDLIAQAMLLRDHARPDEPNQADLRRAFSSAYYAVFHLLSLEVANNWKHERQRHRFARLLDHGRMKQACVKVRSTPKPKDPAAQDTWLRLTLLAEHFSNLQQSRHAADYNHSRAWSRVQVYEEVGRALALMQYWDLVRKTDEAQDFLLDMLGAK